MLHMQAPLLTKVTSYPIYLYTFLKNIYIYIFMVRSIFSNIYIYMYIYLYICVLCVQKRRARLGPHFYTSKSHVPVQRMAAIKQ